MEIERCKPVERMSGKMNNEDEEIVE